MKVLILANNAGGIIKFRRELIERLRKEGNDVVVSIPFGSSFVNDVKIICNNVIETDISRHGVNPIHEFQLLQTYKRIIKYEKPDIVLTFTIKPNVYGGMACSMLHVPYIANITGLGTAVYNKGLMQHLTLLLYRCGMRSVQTVFFQNREDETFFLNNNLAIDKHKMLPGSGVNLQYYQLMEYPDGNKIEFVYVSRLMKEKGIDQYLEAAEYIRKKYDNTRFHICGDFEEDYREKVTELSEKGIVDLHGFVRDMREIYKKIHCVIHPSYYPEGMSNVLLEASACGRPIITTDRSGCKEVVDDGVNGYMIPQKDAKALIAAIEKFLALSNEERRQMGLAGRAKVEKEFDRQIVVEAYLSEIKKCQG